MAEDDAKILAELYEWDSLGRIHGFRSDTHKPDGKLYHSPTDGYYYGADNTGHAGWGFKVWTKVDKTTLKYRGNTVWRGENWRYDARGTKPSLNPRPLENEDR